jgi:pre-mRNA-processing factor 19
LEETRRELSQALYQNDAAVRVVARISMERDAARQELERWNASVGTAAAANGTPTTSTSTTTTTKQQDEVVVTDEPQTKRRRVGDTPLKNDLPEEDLSAMVDTWQTLQPQRKPTLKAAAAAAPTPEALASYAEIESKAWHKSTCRSILCMAGYQDLLVTAGKDKQIVVYDTVEKVVKHSFPGVATCVDIHGSLVAAGDSEGRVLVYSLADGSTNGDLQTEGGKVVDIRIHPTTNHICVATSNGRVLVCCLVDNALQQVASFENDDSVEYSCGALHPDGLLYAAGTTKGQVHMWDFKNKVLASTLQVRI